MSRIAKDLAESAHHPRAHSNESTNANGNNRMQSLKHAASKVPNIAVVGAGVAGLRCADVLLQAGAQVTIFEARDRIGGRLHQQESGGYLMDMGPNWIHGTKGNPILKLAETTKTCLLEPNEDGTVFDAEGRRRTREESSEMSSTMWELVVEAFKYSDHNTKSIAPGTGLYDYFQSELSERNYSKAKLKDNLDEAHMWGPFIGESIRRQSLKFFFLEECIEGENVFVASTYKPILEQIGRAACSSNIIRFNTEVTNIARSTSSISLTTSTDATHTFDEVILTTPLGWLKHNLHAFTPPLPSPLTSAINNISYGRLEKLYVTFPTAWWLTDNPSPGFPSHAQPDLSSYPMFTHFHSPTTYHPLAPPLLRRLEPIRPLPRAPPTPTRAPNPPLLPLRRLRRYSPLIDFPFPTSQHLIQRSPNKLRSTILQPPAQLLFVERRMHSHSAADDAVAERQIQRVWELFEFPGWGGGS